MAQIIIDIPDVKKDWIINGVAAALLYPDFVVNPDFNDMEAEDPITNPSSIPNPQSKTAFIKMHMIDSLKKSAVRGNSINNIQVQQDEADSIDIT